jgi:ABC-type oligopeptide transport system substrate-binding subunit
MKKLIVIFLAIVMISGFAICGNSEGSPSSDPNQSQGSVPKKDTLTMAFNGEPRSIDFHYIADTIAFTIGFTMYETLVVLNDDLSYSLGLADDMQISDDGLNYT